MSSGGQITVKLLMLDSVLRFTTNGNTLEYQISGVVCITLKCGKCLCIIAILAN